jgi:hypothetical protein
VSTIVSVWAGVALAAVVGLVVAAARIGRNRAAAWLTFLGLLLVTLEEPAITFWLGLSGPRSDPDGLAGSVTPMARAHVLDAGVYGLAAAVLLGWVALTAFPRGERWARRVLGWALVVVAVTEAATTLAVYSRGLPVPGTPGGAAFGWQPVAVGLVAWTVGLWLGRARQRSGSYSGAVAGGGWLDQDAGARRHQGHP